MINSVDTAAFFVDIARATISLMGVGILVGYSLYSAHLSKKEIIAPVILAAIFGLIVTIGPHIFIFLILRG